MCLHRSLGDAFGSKIMTPDGIILNNALKRFSKNASEQVGTDDQRICYQNYSKIQELRRNSLLRPSVHPASGKLAVAPCETKNRAVSHHGNPGRRIVRRKIRG